VAVDGVVGHPTGDVGKDTSGHVRMLYRVVGLKGVTIRGLHGGILPATVPCSKSV